MSIRHYFSATALVLPAGLSLVACDKASHPSEVTAQEVSTRDFPSGTPAAARATPSRYSIKGPYAQVYATSRQGPVLRQVQLDLYASGSDQAYLYYSVWECDPATFDCVLMEEGSGLVSGDELTTSRGRITVNTNTAGNPAFDLWSGSGGPINVTWNELSGWSSRISTHGRYRSAEYSSHSHGTFTTTGALAVGAVLGVQVEPGNGFGVMGTVKEGGITITR